MVRDELALAEWVKSQQVAKRESLQKDMQKISLELERNLQVGVGRAFAQERFQWLEDTAQALEQLSETVKEQDQQISLLRSKLQEAYQERRVAEIIQARKESALRQQAKREEQKLQDEASRFRYATQT